MSIELKVGEWYETRMGTRVRVIADASDIPSRVRRGDPIVVLCEDGRVVCYYPCGGYWYPTNPTRGDPEDIVKHLPGCTGWDWVDPKPEKWRDATPEDATKKPHLRCRVQLSSSGCSAYAYGELVGYYVSGAGSQWVVNLSGTGAYCSLCQVLDK